MLLRGAESRLRHRMHSRGAISLRRVLTAASQKFCGIRSRVMRFSQRSSPFLWRTKCASPPPKRVVHDPSLLIILSWRSIGLAVRSGRDVSRWLAIRILGVGARAMKIHGLVGLRVWWERLATDVGRPVVAVGLSG